MQHTTCPKCGTSISPMALRSHLESRHGISFPNMNEIASQKGLTLGEYSDRISTGDAYTEGSPLNYSTKDRLSQSEAEETIVKYGEDSGVAIDQYGNEIIVEEPALLASELKRRAREQGVNVKYVHIQGSQSMMQYENPTLEDTASLSLTAWAIFIIIVAAAIIAVLLTVYQIIKMLYELGGVSTLAAGSAVIVGLIVVGGLALYTIISK